jgi:hypothetical protein
MPGPVDITSANSSLWLAAKRERGDLSLTSEIWADVQVVGAGLPG